MALIVQKFGGTSVATEEARRALLNHVKKSYEEGNKIVVVVSAMGRMGDPYATDTFLSLLTNINSEVNLRTKDLMMSCGEIISCAMIAHYLESNGIAAVPMTGQQAGIVTTDTFGNSEIISINTDNITKHLNQDKVVVIAGFQGATDNGEVTTLGRGGSDTAAVTVGGYLGADFVDIYTDVKGIAKVDPRVVPEAEYLTKLTYEDTYLLASNGAGVIHPRAVKTAQDFNILTRVRSTFSDNEGTMISDERSELDSELVGMAIKKDEYRLYLLFTEQLDDEKQTAVETFIKSQEFKIESVQWEGRELIINFRSEQLVEATKLLYRYFHN